MTRFDQSSPVPLVLDFKGGSPERDEWTDRRTDGRMEILVSNIGLNNCREETEHIQLADI